ncbi:MAG: DUF2384 domain-containing protein [Blastocatellia bacterium]|nr:DUF2384 domain-containing protein [Blastocatellia bacterium]
MSNHTLDRAAAEPLTFDAFMEKLHEPDDALSISPKRYVEELRLDVQTLADQAKVHRNTVARSPETEALQRYLRDALRVMKAAADLSGDMKKALFWFRNHPLQPFQYKTAEQLVADGKADAVVRYISMLEAGPAG